MNRKDIQQLVGGLVFVILIVAVAVMLPTYQLPDGKIVRRFIWDPPMMKIGHGYDLMSPVDIERLSKDPRQREILEGMKNLKREQPLQPIWIGTRYSPRKNFLGFVALSCVFLYGMFAVHKWTSRG